MLCYIKRINTFQFYRNAVVHGLCGLEPDPDRERERARGERPRDGDCERARDG